MSDSLLRVQSPCIRNCCLGEDDVCLGCFRQLAEITRWSESDDVERRLILQKARTRKAVHEAKMTKWRY